MSDTLWTEGWYDGNATHKFNKDAAVTNTCRECWFMSRISRTLPGLPDWCNKHHHAKKSDDPVCKDYVAKDSRALKHKDQK